MTSASWHFEKQHGWSGLLVEPLPSLYQQLVSKNRSTWAIQTCLSTKKRPETIRFSLTGSSEETQAGILADNAAGVGEVVEMQCMPIFSLLLALGNPTVDFLSLDIEGAELAVLKTLPWDKVDIELVMIEINHSDKQEIDKG